MRNHPLVLIEHPDIPTYTPLKTEYLLVCDVHIKTQLKLRQIVYIHVLLCPIM